MVGIIVVNVGKTIINHWPSRKSPYRPFSNEWLIYLFYPQDRIYNNQAKLRNYHQKEIFNQVMKGCSDGCGSCLGIANQFQGESMGRTIKLAYFMCVCVCLKMGRMSKKCLLHRVHEVLVVWFSYLHRKHKCGNMTRHVLYKDYVSMQVNAK